MAHLAGEAIGAFVNLSVDDDSRAYSSGYRYKDNVTHASRPAKMELAQGARRHIVENADLNGQVAKLLFDVEVEPAQVDGGDPAVTNDSRDGDPRAKRL